MAVVILRQAWRAHRIAHADHISVPCPARRSKAARQSSARSSHQCRVLFFLFHPAHFGKVVENILLNGMVDIEIILQRQSAHFGMCQHGGVFARAVIKIGRGFYILLDHGLENSHIAGHVRAALQMIFLNPDLCLHALTVSRWICAVSCEAHERESSL